MNKIIVVVAEEYKKRRVAGKREARTIISVIAFSLLHLFHYSSTTLLLDDTLLSRLGPLIGERKQSPDTVECYWTVEQVSTSTLPHTALSTQIL